MGFPCVSADKESTCIAGDLGFDPWVGKIPRRRKRLPTPVFGPGEFLGLYRTLSMESKRAGQLSLSLSPRILTEALGSETLVS